MRTMTEPNNLGDLLKYEAPNLYSREAAPAGSDPLLTLGTVIARHDDGTFWSLDPNATDGSEVAYGIVGMNVDMPQGAQRATIVIVRHATIADRLVQWPANITEPQKAAAILQLEARGILIRTAV